MTSCGLGNYAPGSCSHQTKQISPMGECYSVWRLLLHVTPTNPLLHPLTSPPIPLSVNQDQRFWLLSNKPSD